MIHLFLLVKSEKPRLKIKFTKKHLAANFGHNDRAVILRLVFESWIEAIKFTVANKEEIYAVTDSREEMMTWSPYKKL